MNQHRSFPMAEGTSVLRTSIRSLDDQPPLPRDRFIVADQPDDEAIPMDVVFVGGGPAGLAGAIELARAEGQRIRRRGWGGRDRCA
ncbi:MAG: hypothetical protein ACKVIN_01145 [Longimicrobiales bacterium]